MSFEAAGSVESDQDDASSPSTSIPWDSGDAGAGSVTVITTALATGGDTMKLLPHFLHLIREPIRLGGILPRSPQVGHVTDGIVPTSLRPGGSRRAVLYTTSVGF